MIRDPRQIATMSSKHSIPPCGALSPAKICAGAIVDGHKKSGKRTSANLIGIGEGAEEFVGGQAAPACAARSYADGSGRRARRLVYGHAAHCRMGTCRGETRWGPCAILGSIGMVFPRGVRAMPTRFIVHCDVARYSCAAPGSKSV